MTWLSSVAMPASKVGRMVVDQAALIEPYKQAGTTLLPLEGTKNKIKFLQEQACGFRDHLFFKLKIYALHETQ